MPDFASLIERVRSGSGADRELDAAIYSEFGTIDGARCKTWCAMDGRTDLTREMFIAAWAPDYTSSLDAVVRLVEENLPGWGYQSGRPIQKYGATGWYATVFREQREDERGEPFAGTYSCPKPLAGDYASTQARALLGALLLALQAQEAS